MVNEEIQVTIVKIENLLANSKFEDAITLATELLKHPSLKNDIASIAKINTILGEAHYLNANYLKALDYTEEALQLNEKIIDKKGILANLSTLGNIYNSLANYPKALDNYNSALQLNQEIADKFGMASNLGKIGFIYSSLSNYPKALENYKKALQLNQEIGNENGITQILNNVGNVYQNISNNSKALEYFKKALQLNQEIKNISGIAMNLNNIGNVYYELLNYPKALEYYEKSLQLSQEIENKRGITISIGNIGMVYNTLSNFPKSLEYLEKALQLNQEIENIQGITMNLTNLGSLYTKFLNYPKALEYYEKSLQLSQEIENKTGLVSNLNNLGEVYNLLSDHQKAITYLESAYSLSLELGTKITTLDILQNFSKVYEQLGDIETAFSYYKQYIALEKEIISEEATKKAILFDQQRQIEEVEKAHQLKLARFQEQERIFHKILPIAVADRMIEGEQNIAESYDHVSIFFSDIVNFTALSSTISAKELVTGLNKIFSEFDRIAVKYGIEKIKTIGDAYMAACGVPDTYEDHAKRMAAFALEISEVIHTFTIGEQKAKVNIRIGLHCGEVVAGVIGENKFAYDLWGDAVNTASRMESHGEAGRIHVSEYFRKALSNSSFNFIERGEMEVKGKGMMKTYFLENES